MIFGTKTILLVTCYLNSKSTEISSTIVRELPKTEKSHTERGNQNTFLHNIQACSPELSILAVSPWEWKYIYDTKMTF